MENEKIWNPKQSDLDEMAKGEQSANWPTEADGVKDDFEDGTLKTLNKEVYDIDNESFGNGTFTNADEIDDNGLGSDIDDMTRALSGQADYESEYGTTEG